MKRLLTAIACFFALSMSAQTSYNPDSNGDNYIGSHDLLDFLPLYNTPFFADDSVIIQTIDSVTPTVYCASVEDIFAIDDSLNCVSYSSFEDYGDFTNETTASWYGGSCTLYYTVCISTTVPENIHEDTNWVDNIAGSEIFYLPIDSSWKQLYIAFHSNFNGSLFFVSEELEVDTEQVIMESIIEGVGLGAIVSSVTGPSVLVLIRDPTGSWFLLKS